MSDISVFTKNNYRFSTVAVPEANYTGAYGINDYGQIVGYYRVDIGNIAHIHGFIDTEGAFATIDAPGAVDTYATGVNLRGQVVGYYTSNTGSHGFVETDGRFSTINGPGAISTNLAAINDFGQIVGTYQDQSYGNHSFVYAKGRFTSISVPGSTDTFANGINDFGQVVGSYTDQDGISHGFLYRRGVYATIDAPGAERTVVWGINNFGQMVGDYNVGGVTHGFIDSHGTFVTVDAPGADYYTHAIGLNDFAAISGQYGSTSGLQGSFVATPRFIGGIVAANFSDDDQAGQSLKNAQAITLAAQSAFADAADLPPDIGAQHAQLSSPLSITTPSGNAETVHFDAAGLLFADAAQHTHGSIPDFPT